MLPAAIANGVYPVVHRFLEEGIQINAFLENGMTPLMVAGKGGLRGDCWTALAMAARCGHDEIVSRLLECEAIDTDVISTETDTTSPASSPGSLLGMLEQEWYYEWQNNTSQKQGHALFWAVVQGRVRCVLALLQSDR
ncbi:hypothetical protein G3M48_005764 [Beauveria asiatica]|uniref:Ankyrin repeat protein n=1 Tax=Beauveria asiatica TaxID=1069075 RepID=A0AAW0RQS5_9HYPO